MPTKYCPICNQFLPVESFPIKSRNPIKYRPRCKKCYYLSKIKPRRKVRRRQQISTKATPFILNLFSHYETHPVLSPLVLSNNISLQTAGFSPSVFPEGDYRTSPDHFMLFHLIPHKYHPLACKLFKEKYSLQAFQDYILPNDISYAQFLHPSLYTPQRIFSELYETDHHLFKYQPHNPYRTGWRYRRSRLMRKLSRFFYFLPCRVCHQTKLTYHINFSPTLNSQPVHWLRYLYETIFSYWDFYPLAYNFLPAFNRKYGWDNTCLSCRNLPLINWFPHEIDQGFSTRYRVYQAIKEHKLISGGF